MDRILIVEDEPQIAGLLADYFRNDGAEAHVIGNGDLVLPFITRQPVDAVLLDIMLPGKDGLTLCREIRQSSDVPILMLTARVDEID
ncbi:MAG: response regulator, partial [Pseudomonadales bacterium]|nr:response regulator [Pseudomonadales bacterium]